MFIYSKLINHIPFRGSLQNSSPDEIRRHSSSLSLEHRPSNLWENRFCSIIAICWTFSRHLFGTEHFFFHYFIFVAGPRYKLLPAWCEDQGSHLLLPKQAVIEFCFNTGIFPHWVAGCKREEGSLIFNISLQVPCHANYSWWLRHFHTMSFWTQPLCFF